MPKSETMRLAVVVEQEVAGLYVSMDDAGGMRGVQRAGGLVEPGDGRVVRHSALTKAVCQGSAAQVFHDDERRRVGFADVEDGHHIGMESEAAVRASRVKRARNSSSAA